MISLLFGFGLIILMTLSQEHSIKTIYASDIGQGDFLSLICQTANS